ncbi:hypothetical protein [Pyxidicoccus trucidator]|uniref:hypothetical protein n=1 Tax=Pyxidicoccus trucidator TaxID=2709662 RepID=UPI001967DC0E|nr:hypothetical protein [Pyxidicoccus trucidator]
MARGVVAGLMLGAQALAQGSAPPPVQPPAPETESVQGREQVLSGRVLGASTGILYIESELGPAVPLRVTHATRLQGRRIPREQGIEAYLRQALPPGKTVRVTFDVRTHDDGTPENVVRTLDVP